MKMAKTDFQNIIETLIEANIKGMAALGFGTLMDGMEDSTSAYAHMALNLWREGGATNGHCLIAAWAMYTHLLNDLKDNEDGEDNGNNQQAKH